MEELIEKWQNKHSKLLEEYNLYPKLTENEALFLRSEMRQVVEIIDDLRALVKTSDDASALPIPDVIPSLQHLDDMCFHECPNCSCRCNCSTQPCSCCNEV